MSAKKWFYSKADSQVGPISTTELLHVLHTEPTVVNCATIAWREGLDTWKAIQHLPELFLVDSSGT